MSLLTPTHKPQRKAVRLACPLSGLHTLGGAGETHCPTLTPARGVGSCQHHRNLVSGAPTGTERCPGEGELLFALIHSGPILPELVEGDNRQVLPVFWRFCPIAKAVGGRQRLSGQAMHEKQRDSGANRGWRK